MKVSKGVCGRIEPGSFCRGPKFCQQRRRNAEKEEGSGTGTESPDAQEYESSQQNDTDVDVDEDKEELSFVPSAVSCSARWREPKFMCDRPCREEGFPYFDVASVMVEENGELCTINLCDN